MATQTSDQAQKNLQLYLAPELLTANEANEKARPGEKPADRAARVAEMADSIRANGQELPVLIIEVADGDLTTYQYVDGGCRVEAVALLKDKGGAGAVKEVWCSLVDPTEDLFKKAVIANLHRTQNSLLDMPLIVQEVLERNDWKGKGANDKAAKYLGLGASRVSEYLKIQRAPEGLRKRIESGEIGSLDAALKLMAVPDDKRERVADRATELAKEDHEEEEAKAADKAEKAAKKRKGNPTPEVPKPNFNKPNVPKVKAKHVEKAKREEGLSKSPRSKGAIVEFFEAISPAAFPAKAAAFAEYLVKWIGGEGTDKRLLELFDSMAGSQAPKKAVKDVKVVKKAVAKKAAKASKPVKKVAKAGAKKK